MKFSPDDMRARFQELKAARDQGLAKSKPLRDKRDALFASMEPVKQQIESLTKRIADIETPLLEGNQEMAMLCRALNGKTGAPK